MRRLTALRNTAVLALRLPIIRPSCGRKACEYCAALCSHCVADRRYTHKKCPRWARVFNARAKSSDSSTLAARGNAAPASVVCTVRVADATGATTAVLALSRENRAAFGAARCDHTATAFGGHTGAKTVVAFATDNRRLECTFHDLLDSVWCAAFAPKLPSVPEGSP